MLIGRIKLFIASVGAILVALVAAFLRGKSVAVEAEKRKDLQDYADTRKRIDEVRVDNDPGVIRDWLRERGKQ